MFDWHEPAAGLGGGLFVALIQWFLGRSDTAATRRRTEIAEIAARVVTEAKIDIRLNTIEVVLPRIEATLAETNEAAKATRDTLNELLISGRMSIKKD